MIDQVRELRFLKKDPVIPDAFKITAIKVKTPTVNDQISRLVGQLTANPPSFHLLPPHPGPEGQRKATLLEKVVKALWERMSIDAYGSAGKMFRRLVDKAVETGEGVLKIIYRPDRWDANTFERLDGEDAKSYNARTYKYKQKAKLPIVARVVDRRNWYPYRDEDGLCQVIEMTERTCGSIAQDWGDTGKNALRAISRPVPENGLTNYNPGHKVHMVEYWDREWVVYLVTDGASAFASSENHVQLLAAYKHGYGRVPYFDGAGEETSSDDPNYENLSAAFPILWLAPFLDSLYTMWANIGYLTGFPTFKEKPVPGVVEAQIEEDSDEQDAIIDFSPGKLIKGDIEVLQYGPLAQAITGMVSEVKSMMSSAMLPSIMQGVPPGSRTAGFAIQELASAAKSKYQATVESVSQCIAEAMNFALWLIEHKVSQSIPLLSPMLGDNGVKYNDYLKVNPDDIDGYYAVEVSIKPRNPAERYQEATVVANMHAAGVATKRQIIEAYSDEHPDEVLEEKMVEDWLDTPEVKQFVQQEALKKAGLAGFQAQIAAAQQMMQMQQSVLSGVLGSGTAPGGQGGPGGPGGPPGTNGLAGGTTNGNPSVTAPKSPGMEVPGMPASPGAGMSVQNPFGGQKPPRMYRGTAGSKPGFGKNQPAKPAINGFKSR